MTRTLDDIDAEIRMESRSTDPEASLRLAKMRIAKGDALRDLGRPQDALGCYAQVVSQCGSVEQATSRRQARIALVRMGSVLLILERLSEAEVAFDRLLAEIQKMPLDESARQRALAVIASSIYDGGSKLAKVGHYESALFVAEMFLGRFAQDPPKDKPYLVPYALSLRAKALAGLGQAEKALAALQDLDDRYAGADDIQSRISVAKALNDQARLMDDRGEFHQAVAVCKEVLTRFGEATDPQLCEYIAVALAKESDVLRTLGQHEEALGVENELLRRFSDTELPGLPYVVLNALANKGLTLELLRRTQDALTVYETIGRDFAGRSSDPQVRIQIAYSHERRSALYIQQHCYEKAVAAADNALAVAGDGLSCELAVYLANALLDKALALGQLGRWADILTAIDNGTAMKVIGEMSIPFEDPARILVSEAIGTVRSLGATACRELGSIERALEMWSEVVVHNSQTGSPRLRALIRRALRQRAELLLISGQCEEALIVADSLILESKYEEDDEARVLLAESLAIKGAALNGLNRDKDAITVFDDLIDRFAESSDTALRAQVALALYSKAKALSALGLEDDSRKVRGVLVAECGDVAVAKLAEFAIRYGKIDKPDARELLAEAAHAEALILRDLGRTEEACNALRTIVAEFGDDENAAIMSMVADARNKIETMESE